jgi:hypothetical protein
MPIKIKLKIVMSGNTKRRMGILRPGGDFVAPGRKPF